MLIEIIGITTAVILIVIEMMMLFKLDRHMRILNKHTIVMDKHLIEMDKHIAKLDEHVLKIEEKLKK